ncbi:IS110 family transposase [Algibacillus agarilyticus]|uniref:IS110 family transposase n=1 Tax=Algibacillus agarilyticus TaxID=2234133 RepID=UPI000DD0D1E6|nr:IS110 family transposase [Algibacillus agarilyticus]
MKCSVISIDLAKNIFQICGLDENRNVLFNKKVKRSALLHELRQHEPTQVAMEACYSSNPWGRRIKMLGHKVSLLPAFAVKPFVIGNKNDRNDALAIAEAFFRPTIRKIEVKSLEAQDIQSLQRVRERMIKIRTGDANQLRGLLAEYGVVVPRTRVALMNEIPIILECNEMELTATARKIIRRLYQNLQNQDEQLDAIQQELDSLVKDKKEYKRLMTIPGVGPVLASAIMGSVTDANTFKNGRQFAAWTGITPSQHASGDKNRMGKITKRGNSTLRRLFIMGARAVMNWCTKKDTSLHRWARQLKSRMHGCKAVVALANKLARITWSVMAYKQDFDINKACA